jgi:hypothetical protein
MPMAKLALVGLVCFMAGAAWIALIFAELSRNASIPGTGTIVSARAAEFLCLVGFVLLAGACLLALVRTIYRRFNA